VLVHIVLLLVHIRCVLIHAGHLFVDVVLAMDVRLVYVVLLLINVSSALLARLVSSG
jgi:hypothetical protein